MVITHKSFDDYWNSVLSNASAPVRARKIAFKQDMDNKALEIARRFGVLPRQASNICYLFTKERAIRELSDFENRAILFNLGTVITLQIRAAPNSTTLIVTAHRKQGFKIFTTTVRNDPSVLNLLANRSEE